MTSYKKALKKYQESFGDDLSFFNKLTIFLTKDTPTYVLFCLGLVLIVGVIMFISS